MYNSFFGFKERPFQLVPNPAYLFLSRCHEEAMAHLTYALSQGDGFVEITGEVGTGKTTLCRAFLENLDQNTEAAYIFNPKLNSLQLVKSINDEFGIPSDADNLKDLIDTLNAFLLKKKSEGKRVIVVVDEAQNLTQDVLEQLRLLSNLETTTSKLLQIVLVGQPELGDMLDSQELRQLGQRITLSYNLNPLNFRETREYIRHRLQVALQKPGVKFTWWATRTIYRYSGGIPRVINIACDRALLTAFGLDRRKITANIAAASIRELAGRGEVRRYGLARGKRGTLVAVLICACLFLIILYRPVEVDIGNLFRTGQEKAAPVKKEEKIAPKVLPKPEEKENSTRETMKPPAVVQKEQGEEKAAEPAVKPSEDLGAALAGTSARASRSAAMKAAMGLWVPTPEINTYLEGLGDDQAFFRLAAKQNGLLVHRLEADWALLEKLGLPAVLEFRLRGSQGARYMTLTRLDADWVIMRGADADGRIRVDPRQVRSLWSRVAYIPWKDYLDYPGVIPHNAPRESIITLKMLLQDIGFADIEITPYYDEKTREAVKTVQEKHGIRVDGIVGPITKMILYKEKKTLKLPSTRG